MLSITNVSENSSDNGKQRYTLKLNGVPLCHFDHDRIPQGIAACLRDAANALDKHDKEIFEKQLEQIMRTL